MNFLKKLEAAIKKNNSLLCIGLDTDIVKIPPHLLKTKDPIFLFNKSIIDSTHDLVCAYKPNIAYYSALGIYGLKSLQKTIEYIHSEYKDIPVILDAKRGDIGNTSENYAVEVFEVFQADALTVNPYLGLDAIQPFLKYKDKGIIVLCRTSNPGASDFQNLKVREEKLYIKVAKKIIEWDQAYKNCLMVVGATWPQELSALRSLAPNMFFLVPGVGAQGGDVEKTLKAGLNKNGSGLIISLSRAIIYASKNRDFAEQAKVKTQAMNSLINTYRL